MDDFKKRDEEEERMISILSGPEMKARAKDEVVKRLDVTRTLLDKCEQELANAEEMTAHYLGLLDKAGVPVTHELPAHLPYPEDGDHSGTHPRFSARAKIAVLEDQLAAAERREDALRAERIDLAVKLFQGPGLSLGWASKVSGVSQERFMRVLGERQIPVIDYDPAQLDDELKAFPPTERTPRPGCREDFYAWLLAQAKALREGRFGDVDRKYLPDFLEGRAESILCQFSDDAMLYFIALNDWYFGDGQSDDAEKVHKSRRGACSRWRDMKSNYLDASPSIKALLPGMMQEIYEQSKSMSCDCPEKCPYGPEVFEDDFEVVADKWFVK